MICLSFVLAVLTSLPEESQKPPEVGDVAPSFENLPGTDGKNYSLKQFAKTDVLVICFSCNTCPYSVDYENRLNALHQKFTKEGLSTRLLVVNSNSIPADSLDEMKKRATSKMFGFPYVKDESQRMARDYGAIYTPEFFVLDKSRRVVFKGAMDDSTKAADVKKKYVELAVTAALSGKHPEVTKAGARGCAIRFKRRRR